MFCSTAESLALFLSTIQHALVLADSRHFLPRMHVHPPALLPSRISSVNVVVVRGTNVKPPITQSVAFYPVPLSCHVFHAHR